MRSKHNSGFTLVETLSAVAILVILLAVSSVPVAKHVNTLKVMELDNAARDIYMAAQNRAVLLSGAGSLQLDALVNPDKSEAHLVTLESDQAKHDGEKNYYVAKDDAKGNLLTAGSIDETLWDGDFYIVYDLNSGSVTDVFYAKKTINLDDGFAAFYTKSAVLRETRVKAKNFVGWYSGEAAEGKNSDTHRPDTPEDLYFDVEVENAETLTVTVTVKGKKYVENISDTLEVRLGRAGDGELTADNSIKLAFEQGAKPEAIDADSYVGVWTLDSLRNGQFKDLKDTANNVTKFVTPGEDFKVVGTLTIGDETFTDSDEDNSLFWNDYDAIDDKGELLYNSNEKTAYIKYLRHLQNLDAGDNGFNSGVPTGDEAKAKTSAIQVADISGTDYNFVPIINTALKTYDGSGNIIGQLRIGRTGENYLGLFGINYDICTIENVTVKDGEITGNENVGSIAGDNRGTVQNCKNEGTPVEGSTNVGGLVGSNNGTLGVKDYPNTSSGNVTGTTAVGGIAGANAKDRTVDGNYNTIASAITVTGTSSVGGFVGTNGGTVQNCTRSKASGDVDIKVTADAAVSNIGGIVGSNDENGKVLGCVNESGLDAGPNSMYVGGIVGWNNKNTTVSDCTNGIKGTNTTVTGMQRVGGIVGYTQGTVGKEKNDTTTAKCVNYANVTATITSEEAYAGGIAGESFSANARLAGCENYGSVTANSGGRVGGIVGSNNGTVTGCINGFPATSATVKGSKYVGGIVGYNEKGKVGTVQDESTSAGCVNHAAVTSIIASDDAYVGGIAGSSIGAGAASLSNCTNDGTVTANAKRVGGIAGQNSGTVTGCTNDAKAAAGSYAVSGSQYVGGIVGSNTGTVGGTGSGACVNNAAVYASFSGGQAFVGGIVGENTGSGASVKNCTNENEGDVTAQGGSVAGIAGRNASSGTVGGTTAEEGCVNKASVTTTYNGTYTSAGGIVGENNGATTYVNQCKNEGSISAVNGSRVGGVVGLNQSGHVENCSNVSEITVTGKQYVGGIVGYNDGTGEVKSCTNECNITVGENVTDVGGIAGYNKGTVGGTGNGEECVNKAKITSSHNSGGDPNKYSNAGGVVGCSIGSVLNCVNQGSVDASDGARVGGIVGYLNGGAMRNCRNVEAKVSGNIHVGGIAGFASNITVETSYNTGDVSGKTNVGGVVGFLQNEQLNDCYNTGDVSGTQNVGGVAGYSNTGNLKNCYGYNIGVVTGTPVYDRVLGAKTSTEELVQSCYYLVAETNNMGGLTEEQFKIQDNFKEWAFGTIWVINAEKGRPTLIGNPET